MQRSLQNRLASRSIARGSSRPESHPGAARARRRALALSLLMLAAGLSGCVYRMDIQQGNYLAGPTVQRLKVGMTRSQVRYLLGTPMIADIFNRDRWDYLYYFKQGYVRRPVESRVSVFFRSGKVSRFRLMNIPKGRPLIPGVRGSAKKFPIF